MLVCHCERVNDRTIRKCAREGARNHLDVAMACGAGSRCGGCRPLVDELIAETHAEASREGLFHLPMAGAR
ncbi:MAG: (2Fe-2S)-binding protein [Sandaracinaceae bacterium]|nr:(2Fe-2S)-binding protein [Sandaracinaceae bacterium]